MLAKTRYVQISSGAMYWVGVSAEIISSTASSSMSPTRPQNGTKNGCEKDISPPEYA